MADYTWLRLEIEAENQIRHHCVGFEKGLTGN
jgi:hypothetical protein